MRTLLVFCALAAVPLPVGAERYGAAGVNGAFLTRAASPRASGLAGAFTAVADDASAVVANPGGLGQIRSFEAVAMRDAMVGAGRFRDDLGVTFVAAALPLGPGVGGVAVTAMDWGTYERRDAWGAAVGPVAATDVAVAASWAAVNPGWFGRAGWSGIAVETVREASGRFLLGFSGGSVIPIASAGRVGWALEHVGLAADGSALPALFKLGASLAEARAPFPLRLSLDVAYPFVQGRFWIGAGAEASPFTTVRVRLGYRWRAGGDGLTGPTGVAAGAGVRLGSYGLDWAWQPFGDLVTAHRIAVTYAFLPAPKTVRRETVPDLGVERAPAAPPPAGPASADEPASRPDAGSAMVERTRPSGAEDRSA